MRFAAALALALVACGGKVDPVANGDAGAPSPTLGATNGSAPSDATQVVARANGGYTARTPTGSACQTVDSTWTIVFATNLLTWKNCDKQDAGLYDYEIGSKTLTQDEAAQLKKALGALATPSKHICASDLPSYTLTFTTNSGERMLADARSRCSKKDENNVVEGMESVFRLLYEITD